MLSNFFSLDLLSLYPGHPQCAEIKDLIAQGKQRVHITGLCGSSLSLIGSTLVSTGSNVHVFVMIDKEEAEYFLNDLLSFFKEAEVSLFPSSYKRPGQSNVVDQNGMVQRTELLNHLNNFLPGQNTIVVSYPEALAEKVVTRSKLEQNTLHLSEGEKLSIDFLVETFHEYQFERSDFVYEPGQYSVRGSIVDVFSYADEVPYRIDFFGDTVDSIRSFDLETQLSINRLNKIHIVPDVQKFGLKAAKVALPEYLPDGTVFWFKDLNYTVDRLQSLLLNPWHQHETRYDGEDAQMMPELADVSGFIHCLSSHQVIDCSNRPFFDKNVKVEFKTAPQPAFNKNFELLVNNLHENIENGYENIIISDNPKQFDRLNEIFASIDKQVHFKPLELLLHEGFVDHDLKICVYTDHQIFERYHKFRFKHNFTRNEALVISQIHDLHPGDYVVHIDHGVGKFGGIEKVELNGRWQEVIKLVYRDNDVLYVSIHSLHRIAKYKSKENEQPKIYKLGSGAWQKLKTVTKKKVKDIARDLIALYAKRKESPGFQFAADTYMQQELEASFIYEDTPDQEKATRLVKKGMEGSYPMEMLVCGDVGFGKTEVAVRAAFKAVSDSKQVAILVPTTILAYQHFTTFSNRLKNFPCTVDYINRFRSPKEQKDTLKKLIEGKVDILIGTHRILSKDIKFKDLGLLIIDEEQKFGVSMKEKLRQIKLNVDTLTLTATPIPRTLQFSLMGARDLAIINTPPPNRHPIATELHVFNEDIFKEGIMYEVSRGGQVFFINNRVQNIYEMEKLINRILPKIKTVVAHGQMEGQKLERVMFDFINGDYDVLIATSIIENGLDISNANTIFINDAHHFGLSDLHQLRGRVGRSNKKAFCYLLAPPVSTLTPEARRRLKAIEEFSELGSGFNIAMQDLDIRGAGNMLGAEQSGFIAEMGYETYQRILNEAMLELKEEEFKDLFEQEATEIASKKEDADSVKSDIDKTSAINNQSSIINHQYLTDCAIDTDLEILIPEYYVESIAERIKLYRELDNIEDEKQLESFKISMKDRFGEIPQPVHELMDVVRLRRIAMKMGFEKITIKNERMIIYFISNQQSPYYQSAEFSAILGFVQRNPRVFQMREAKDKLTMVAEGVKNVKQVLSLFEKMRMVKV